MQQTKALTVGRRRPRLRRRLRKRQTTTTTQAARLLGRSRDAHGVSAVPEYFYDFCLGARGTDFSGAKPPCDLSVRIHPSVHPCSFPPLSLSLSLSLFVSSPLCPSPWLRVMCSSLSAGVLMTCSRNIIFTHRGLLHTSLPCFIPARLACTRYDSRRRSPTSLTCPKGFPVCKFGIFKPRDYGASTARPAGP